MTNSTTYCPCVEDHSCVIRFTFTMCDRWMRDEAGRIERCFDRAHRHVQEMDRASGVHADVVLRCFDPVHVVDRQKDGLVAGPDGEPCQRPSRIGDRLEH